VPEVIKPLRSLRQASDRATNRREVAYACEDIVALRGRLRELACDIKQKLEQHDLGKLLTTINGVGAQTAAYLIAELAILHGFIAPRH
jgi:transposase